ncbi:hypothetical protein LCGC14_0790900 [marine sediment metagenome]|uniref:Uncharacterized protein n=1 Tax=marine sediment metagenome TaxID=412755 RepID=A0A0F9SZL1_9ZZZZ
MRSQIKRSKDERHMVSKLRLPSGYSRHYWFAYLWDNDQALLDNTVDMGPGMAACCIPAKWVTDFKTGQNEVNPLMGELHFIVDKWSMLVVAHEIQHAIIHRMRVIIPFAWEVMAQDEISSGGYKGVDSYEELVCHEAGKWVNDVYVWLWGKNPHGKLEGYYSHINTKVM